MRSCVALLCALSEHALWLPAWRSIAVEAFSADSFFALLTPAHAPLWGRAVNVLFSRDKAALGELLHGTARVSGGLFSGAKEQEVERARAKQVRRVAFMLWAGQFEQYAQHLPQLEERLVELARSAAESASFRALFLALRLLLCRIATQRLRSFWPFVLTEMMRVLDGPRAAGARSRSKCDVCRVSRVPSVARRIASLCSRSTQSPQWRWRRRSLQS